MSGEASDIQSLSDEPTKSPRKIPESVELATLTRVDWFNHYRLLEPLGYLSPAEFEQAFTESQALPKAP